MQELKKGQYKLVPKTSVSSVESVCKYLIE